MGLHSTLIRLLQARQDRARLARKGPIGDFYRAGGNELLHALPVTTDDVVIDAGGFEGDWAAAMLVRFGCRVELFEPIPAFAEACRRRFARNDRVAVHEAALGASARTARFAIDSVASSEHTGRRGGTIKARVVDVADVVDRVRASNGEVACLKLNIEGGEYEVLEQLAGCGALASCRSVLVQFHAQPEGWEERFRQAQAELGIVHRCAWRFPMVWELWERGPR